MYSILALISWEAAGLLIASSLQGGMYWLVLLDDYSAGFGLMVVVITTCLAVTRIYGKARDMDCCMLWCCVNIFKVRWRTQKSTAFQCLWCIKLSQDAHGIGWNDRSYWANSCSFATHSVLGLCVCFTSGQRIWEKLKLEGLYPSVKRTAPNDFYWIVMVKRCFTQPLYALEPASISFSLTSGMVN